MDPQGFEAVDEIQWRAAAEAGLKGASFEDALVAFTPERIRIDPLYVDGQRPDPGCRRVPPQPWPRRAFVAQHFEASAGDVREPVSQALRAGVEALWIAADDADDVARVLSNIYASSSTASAAPVLLDVGTRASRTLERARELGAQHVSAMFDPFGAALKGWGLDVPLEGALDLAGSLVRDETEREATVIPFTPRALSFSAADVTDAGGTASQAIGYAIAACVEVLRRLETRGIDPRDAARQMAIVAAPGVDVFYGIATLRALRLVWSKGLAAVGVGSSADASSNAPLIVGTTSRRTMSELDRPTNILRASVETFSLLTGGADIVAPRPFDGIFGPPTALGRRLAKNTAIVLQEESRLTAVRDPSSGSYAIEAMTDSLARAGWNELRAIERDGGLIASLVAGRFQRRVEESRLKRAEEIATRARILVGVNDFVASADKSSEVAADDDRARSTRTWPIRALGGVRDSEPFERLRARSRGAPPRVRVVTVGDVKHARARVDFARRFFEAAGFELVSETDLTAPVVVLCGTDAAYARGAAALVRAAKSAGARAIVLAGKPGSLAEELSVAGLTDAIHAGVDVLAAANAISNRLDKDARPTIARKPQ